MKKDLLTYLSGVVVACCCFTAVRAQDTLRLPSTEIVALRSAGAATGLTSLTPDSLLLAQSAQLTLADLLPRNGVYLKSYGGGGLASIGIRGAGASQTPVIWNGINLQSSSNGQNDFALLPVFLFDRLSVQPGSTSAAWGSGAIGGAVFLSSHAIPGERLTAIRTATQFGSFDENGQALQLLVQRSKVAVSLRGVRQRALNNFPYINYTLPDSPQQQLNHAGTFMQAATADLAWIPAGRFMHRFTAHLWLQENKRDLPPTLVQHESYSNQYDQSSRFLVTHAISLLNGRLMGNTRAALLVDELVYTSGYIGDSVSHTQAYSQITETEWKWLTTKGITLNAGLNNTFQQTEVTRFLDQRTQNRTSIFALAEITRFSNWRIAAQLRGEQVNGKFIQPVGSVGAEYRLSKPLALLANISRNYRLPTFNDLYWQPGGNPSLRPEKSWNAEGTLRFTFPMKRIVFAGSFTAFARLVTDWIQWVPQGNIWSPRNVLEVWSRGSECRFDVSYRIRKWSFLLNTGYDYVRAVSLRSLHPNDESVGRQLIYTPAHRAFGVMNIRYKNLYITYTHQFTSHRFTSTDHSTYLPAYQLAQLTFGSKLIYKQYVGEAFIRINNLYNETWEAVALRPVPLRSYQIGIRFDFISKK